MDFDSEGEDVELMQAATVIILRRATAPAAALTATSSAAVKKSRRDTWEVLLGQNCVKNWLRSSPDKDVIMRYPGEWKFPGGVLEPADRSMEQTATRELREEFIGIDAPDSDISLYLVNRKLTKPIKGKRYLMHNFVAMEDDNPWITATDILQIVNTNLQKRVNEFNKKLEDGSFWSLNSEERSEYSPEIAQVQWLSLSDAVHVMGSSLDDRLTIVNEYQRLEFEKYGIEARDPMFQSMVTLLEIEKLETFERIKAQDEVMRKQADGEDNVIT